MVTFMNECINEGIKYLHYTMDFRSFAFLVTVVFVFLTTIVAAVVYRTSRQRATWREARDQCSMFGGELATLEQLGTFRDDVLSKGSDVTIESGAELWVGATLVVHSWKWEGKLGEVFHEAAQNYERGGCFQQQFWHSGTRMDNISPLTCLNHCQWKGIVGLKLDYCMCAGDLANVSLTEYGICNTRCAGSQSNMCGGVHGLSVYQKAKASGSIAWSAGEPRPDNDCVFLRKSDDGSLIELMSSNCQLQMRYLCHFEDAKCGMESTCIRWSTSQATWSDSADGCHQLGAFFAELSHDPTAGLPHLPPDLPPGSFWLALRRYRTWEWTNGKPVYMADFYTNERAVKPDRACAVLSRVGDSIAFAAQSCKSTSHYLCQYDFDPADTADSSPSRVGTDFGLEVSTLDRGVPNPHNPYTSQYNTSRPTFHGPYAVLNVGAVSSKGSNNDSGEDEGSDSNKILNTCMYVILGFLSGMVCVLIIGLIVYLVYRWKNPEGANKHTLLTSSSRDLGGSVKYTTNSDSVRISQPRSGTHDVTYDTVYDLEEESPFRRTQRLIRMGSATAWRQPPTRRERTDTGESSSSRDYTWRGMIGGKIEVVNTQLRHTGGDQSSASAPGTFERNSDIISSRNPNYTAQSLGKARRFPGITIEPTQHQREPNFDITGISTYPSTSQEGTTRISVVSTGSDKNFAFLELEAKTDELSNEENIYATIKKAFDRMKEREEEEQASYNVQ